MSQKNKEQQNELPDLSVKNTMLDLQREIVRLREAFLMTAMFFEVKGIATVAEFKQFGEKYFERNFDLAGEVAVNVYMRTPKIEPQTEGAVQ